MAFMYIASLENCTVALSKLRNFGKFGSLEVSQFGKGGSWGIFIESLLLLQLVDFIHDTGQAALGTNQTCVWCI